MKFNQLSDWGQMILSTPNLLTSLEIGVRFNHVLCTHQRAEFHIKDTTSSYLWSYDDNQAYGKEQVDYTNLLYAIDGIRIGVGSNWSPLEIHTICADLPDLDRFLPHGAKTIIRTNQEKSGIVFETSLLSTSMPGKPQVNYEYSDQELSIRNKIYCLLDAWCGGSLPVIDVIAEMGSMSRVTLYRKLHHEGTSYMDIVDNWRFVKALKLLNVQDRPSSIKEVSQMLKYSNPSNFERSFKRWTGTTPARFRDSILR
jgi:AraC-like DNA-binding protein